MSQNDLSPSTPMNTEEPGASVEDIKHFLGTATIEIPYSKELKRQMAEGRMLEIVRDKKVRKTMEMNN